MIVKYKTYYILLQDGYIARATPAHYLRYNAIACYIVDCYYNILTNIT